MCSDSEPTYLPSEATAGKTSGFANDRQAEYIIRGYPSHEDPLVGGDNLTPLKDYENTLITYINTKYYPEAAENKTHLLDPKQIQFIHRLDITPEEVKQILEGKLSLDDAIYARFLSPFTKRATDQHEAEEQYKEQELDWPYCRGDYGEPYEGQLSPICLSSAFELPDDYNTPEYSRLSALQTELREKPVGMEVSTLRGAELTYADIIKQQIDNNLGDKPVVVLDVGGMLGMTSHRLAAYFKNEIDAGKVAFVNTNLGVTTDDLLDWYYIQDKLRSDEEEFIQNTKQSVHSFKASVPDLLDKEISTPKGNVSLMDNVGLILDYDAVSLHSLIPSIQLPMLASLLREDGVYVSNTWYTSHAPKIDPGRARNYELYRSRAILEREFNLHYVPNVEAGDKDMTGLAVSEFIMRKPNGPAIRGFRNAEQLENEEKNSTAKPT